MNAVEPKFVPTIFAGALAAGADYLDMAMSLSEPHPTEPYAETGREARRRPVRAVARLGDRGSARPRRHGRRARASATCSPATPPTTCSARSTSSAPATARTWWCATRRATRSSPRRSASGRPSRSASTLPSSGRRIAAGSRPRRSREPEVFDVPGGHRPGRVRQRRARGGAAHAALGRREARHLQVRARRRVHRRPEDAQPARPRHDGSVAGAQRRTAPCEVAPRDVVAAALPDPATHRTPDDGQDLRRTVGHRHRHGRLAARGVPVPRERQRVDDGRVRQPVRGLADGPQPGDRARAARDRRLVGHRRARPRGVRRGAVPRTDGEARSTRAATGSRGGSRTALAR